MNKSKGHRQTEIIVIISNTQYLKVRFPSKLPVAQNISEIPVLVVGDFARDMISFCVVHSRRDSVLSISA